MTVSDAVYRATVYEARSDQSNAATEPDILSPAAGAPHSEAFKIATRSGIAGFKPLMGIPAGRRWGRFDPLTRRCDQGELTVPIHDHRITQGGSQADRWLTAQLGSADNRLLPIGCKIFVEESLNGGTSFSPYWTGRIRDVGQRGGIIHELRCTDMTSSLNYEIGLVRPHPSATGVVTPSLLPLGMTSPYGTIPAYRGKGMLAGTFQTSAAGVRYIALTVASRGRVDNLLTAELVAGSHRRGGFASFFTLGAGDFATGLRVRFNAPSESIANKECLAKGFESLRVGSGWAAVTELLVQPVLTTDPFYEALDTTNIPNGTAVTLDVRLAEEPVYFVVATASQLMQDLAAGYYGDLDASGAVKRRVAVNAASFAALPALPTDRWPVKRAKAQDFIERALCQPRNLGYRFNESGELVAFSTALPASTAGLPTLTDADIYASVAPRWTGSQRDAKTKFIVRGYFETPIEIGELPSGQRFPSVPAGLVRYEGGETQFDFSVSYPKDQDLDEGVITIDALGYRAMEGETVNGVDRASAIRGQQAELVEQYRPMFSRGTQRLTCRARRTANTTPVYPGSWALVNLSQPPNPATHARGGQRLMMCTERNESALGIDFTFLDAGAGAQANVPTLGAPAQESGNERYGFTVSVTLNAQSEPVTVWVNDTATSVGVRPADTDARWRLAFPAENFGTPDYLLRSSGTKAFRINPAGRRLWLRARSEIPASGSSKLPSAWVYPGSGTGYVDTNAAPTPTSLAVSLITAKTARLTIVHSDTTLPVAILMGNAASEGAADVATPVQIITLPAGSTVFDLVGLDGFFTWAQAGTWFRPRVAYLDGFGNIGPSVGITGDSFQATGTAVVAPRMAALVVLRSGTGAPAQPSGDIAFVGEFGIELQLIQGPLGTGFDIEVRRGTTSGALSDLRTITAEQTQGRAFIFRDKRPLDNTTYFYDARLVGPGVTPGAYCEEVSAIPGYLPILVNGSEPGEPALGQVEPLQFPGGMFLPESNTTTWKRGPAALRANAAGVTNIYFAAKDVPPGIRIVDWFLVGQRANSADILSAKLYSYTTSAVQIGSLTGNVSGTSLVTETLDLVVDATALVVEVTLRANASDLDASLSYVLVNYVRDSYRQ